LPHLRLFSLTLEQLNQLIWLADYLLPEEKTYLALLVFNVKNPSVVVPPTPESINTNSEPRMRAITRNPLTLQIIPEDMITVDDFRMVGQDVYQCLHQLQKFCLHIHNCQEFCLKGVEILTRANNG